MAQSDALHAALALLKDPVTVRRAQRAELPGGIPAVLAIAMGDEAALAEARTYTGRSDQTLSEAACFFIEQVMLDYHADSYRVLGGTSRSTHDELRHNMALLMRWLHPDLQARRNRLAADREVFSSRVTRAWEDLKNDERRQAYDRLHPASASPGDKARKSSRKPVGAAIDPVAKAKAAQGRRPGHGAKPGMRAHRRFPLGVRRVEGESFWMRLFRLFRRSP